MQDCLIVVGMHRSGTSALAGALHRLGVDFGADLVEAQTDNVRGYYEHRRFLRLHERLLADEGSAWDDLAARVWRDSDDREAATAFREELRVALEEEFANCDLWGVKDPRLSRLLPLWLPVLEAVGSRPHVVFAVRPPAEIAASLARRNGFSREKSGLLWIDHTLAAERASRGLRRAFVDYERLLEEPVAALERLGRQLDLRWPREPAEAAEDLADFLDPGLRHARDDGDAAAWGRAGRWVPALARALRGAVEDPDAVEPFDEVAEAREEDGPLVDPLVMEHLHQFARRHVDSELWTAAGGLQKQLVQVSERLGGALEETEARLDAIAERMATLEGVLDDRTRAQAEREAEVDRTMDHLTEALAASEDGTAHLGESLAKFQSTLGQLEATAEDLMATIARWEGELGIEDRLAELLEKLGAADAALAYLADRARIVEDRAHLLEQGAEALFERVAALEGSRSLLSRLAARWRGRRPDPSSDAS